MFDYPVRFYSVRIGDTLFFPPFLCVCPQNLKMDWKRVFAWAVQLFGGEKESMILPYFFLSYSDPFFLSFPATPTLNFLFAKKILYPLFSPVILPYFFSILVFLQRKFSKADHNNNINSDFYFTLCKERTFFSMKYFVSCPERKSNETHFKRR